MRSDAILLFIIPPSEDVTGFLMLFRQVSLTALHFMFSAWNKTFTFLYPKMKHLHFIQLKS